MHREDSVSRKALRLGQSVQVSGTSLNITLLVLPGSETNMSKAQNRFHDLQDALA